MIVSMTVPYPSKRDYPFHLGTDIIMGELHLGSITKKIETLDTLYKQQLIVLHIEMVKPLEKNPLKLEVILEIAAEGLKGKESKYELEGL